MSHEEEEKKDQVQLNKTRWTGGSSHALGQLPWIQQKSYFFFSGKTAKEKPQGVSSKSPHTSLFTLDTKDSLSTSTGELHLTSLMAQLVKSMRVQCRRPGFGPAGKIPEKEKATTPVFWPGELHAIHRVAKSLAPLSDFHTMCQH